MSDATYILGTTEYIMVEVAVTTPGATFVPADWTAQMLLADSATSVVVEDVPELNWSAATIETVGAKYYVKALLGDDPDPGAGTYRVFVKLTPTSGSELPILRAEGTVIVAGE